MPILGSRNQTFIAQDTRSLGVNFCCAPSGGAQNSLMARKLRIEYEGARYHVINRGNYRRDIFETEGAAQAFEDTLLEACEFNGWRLHAHVVMSNHYHLALETPRANLVSGMHWLQATFASRFNRFRQESGHLFQGRYQALLIEDAAALSRVVDYIHLNPVRAKAVIPDQLAAYRWSSLRRFLADSRPQAFDCAVWLGGRGWTDNKVDLAKYADYLIDLAEDEAEQRRLGLEGLSKGWAIGTAGWRSALAKEHREKTLNPAKDVAELKEIREAHWEEVLEFGLRRVNKTENDISGDAFGAEWKIALARELRGVNSPFSWITAKLNMGKASSVRVYLSNLKINI